MISGVIQGVGFRPFVYREAVKRGITGFVMNKGSRVEIVASRSSILEAFKNPPPLAYISSVRVSRFSSDDAYDGFSIIESSGEGNSYDFPPDSYLCEDCIAELRHGSDRRHGYYFITCTNCGPRFSMINSLPYDRLNTAMSKFEMCEECRYEYENPGSRRYHAQTIACRNCGPRLVFVDKINGLSIINDPERNDALAAACKKIAERQIVAVKGVGGFHLCCLADKEPVSMLRGLKMGRLHKPFAVMVRDLDMLSGIADYSEEEAALLKSPARPILVVKKKEPRAMKWISELDSLGVMLPYTALHYLMFDYLDKPLIMTSANLAEHPLIIEDAELIGIDYVLTHERGVVNRCDDSVIKVITPRDEAREQAVVFLRRSRGFVPLPIRIAGNSPSILALGGGLKNAFAVIKDGQAYLSQHLGSTAYIQGGEFFDSALRRMIKAVCFKPELIACDANPAYYTSSLADRLASEFHAPVMRIQHHHAHVAGVAAEYSLTDYVGIAADGAGLGEQAVWGGEVFDVSGCCFKRVGHLEQMPMIGGDAAALKPRRMLYGILSGFLSNKELAGLNRQLPLYTEAELRVFDKQLSQGFNIALTTSAGRLLDAAAALLGLCNRNTYEGRAAMLLESAASGKPVYRLEPVIEKGEFLVLKTTPLFAFMLDKLRAGASRQELARLVHDYIAEGLYSIAEKAAMRQHKQIVFSGGVAANRYVTGFMLDRGVLVNQQVPCGDGGLCLGQGYIGLTAVEGVD